MGAVSTLKLKLYTNLTSVGQKLNGSVRVVNVTRITGAFKTNSKDFVGSPRASGLFFIHIWLSCG